MAASLVNNAQHRLRRLAREFRFRLNGWTVAAVLLGLFLFLPMAEVLWHITSPAENWEHLRDTVLGRYLKGSAILVVGTAGLSLLLGVSTAWLVACCEFPGRRFFEWALILPLAIPTYIAAFAYFDLLDRLTPLLIWVRTNISPEAMTWLSDMMVYPVTTVVLAAVLYPYVYLVARAAFSRQGSSSPKRRRRLATSRSRCFGASPCPWPDRRSSAVWRW